MMGKQHVQFATVTAIGSYFVLQELYPLSIANPALFFGGTILGSLMPDIDRETSIIGTVLWPISKLINKLFGHRKLTHDILLWLIVAIIMSYFKPITLGFWLGYIGHLFLDSFTKKGIIWGYFFHKNLKRDQYYRGFREGYFYLAPQFLRFYANSSMAKIFTFVMSILYLYGCFKINFL